MNANARGGRGKPLPPFSYPASSRHTEPVARSPPACSSAPSVRFRKIPLRQKRGIKREPLICRLTGRNTAIFCTTRACLPESRAPLLKARGSSFHQKTLLFFLRPGRRTGSVSGKEYGEIFQPGQIPPSRIRGTMRKRSAPAPLIYTEKQLALTRRNAPIPFSARHKQGYFHTREYRSHHARRKQTPQSALPDAYRAVHTACGKEGSPPPPC